MTWKKSPEGLVDRFGEVVPKDSEVERRSMFGYPCAFVNGHMFCGLFQDQFILRLPEGERETFLDYPDSAIFEPMPGRAMQEYVRVPPAVWASDLELKPWLRASRDYVGQLPPKARKLASKAKKAKKAVEAPVVASSLAAKKAKRG
ncbi:MAG: TfoX/Sxy family protein [Polyangiaceae bacterium]|jgi:TfoX/Sxy family transcriptional regulator of competence genes